MNSNFQINEFVEDRNSKKHLFTAGPASLLEENILGLMPCFGRGDKEYLEIEEYVLQKIKSIAGQNKIVRLQGSATLAIEIMIKNFVTGKVLVIKGGAYSERLVKFCRAQSKKISRLKIINIKELEEENECFDWIISCYTETSIGYKFPIDLLKEKANELGGKLMLDSTASIGLEENHHLADVQAFSSCKGLFGLTGGSFICYNEEPVTFCDSYYLNLKTHINKEVTGPYHTICSLYYVLQNHERLRVSVEKNKIKFMEKFKEYIVGGEDKNQPKLCTHVSCTVSAKEEGCILYKARGSLKGSIVCHLGEVHLGDSAKGDIIDKLMET